MGVAPFCITLTNMCYPIPMTLVFVGLESLAPNKRMCPQGDTTVPPLTRKLRLSPHHDGLGMPLD